MVKNPFGIQRFPQEAPHSRALIPDEHSHSSPTPRSPSLELPDSTVQNPFLCCFTANPRTSSLSFKVPESVLFFSTFKQYIHLQTQELRHNSSQEQWSLRLASPTGFGKNALPCSLFLFFHESS